MTILAHPQDDEVQCGKVFLAEESPQVLLIVLRGPLCSALSLDPVNIFIRYRYTGEEQFMNKLEVAVNMLRRDASLVRPKQVDTLPLNLIGVRSLRQKRIKPFRRTASGQRRGKSSAIRHCHTGKRPKSVGSRMTERMDVREYPDN